MSSAPAPLTLIDGRTNAGAAFAANPGAMRIPLNGKVSVHVDCSASNRLANDVLRVLDIPAGYSLDKESLVLQTKEGATLTADIGTYDLEGNALTAQALHVGINLNGTDGGVPTASSGIPVAETATDKCVAILFKNAAANAVFDLVFKLTNMAVGTGGDSNTRYANVT